MAGDSARNWEIRLTEADVRVTRIREEHPAGDDRSRAVDRTALAGHAVDGLKFLRGIRFPEHAAVSRRIGAQHPVGRP